MSETIATELCKCGHARKVHSHGKSCTATGGRSLKFCNCELFRPDADCQSTTPMVDSQQEEIPVGKSNSKKARKSKKAKPKANGNGAVRKPALAPFIENPLPLYANYKGKEFTATALASGLIKLAEVEYPTPSAAARAILGNNEKGKPLQVDGWHFWKFNKDGERVPLGELRDPKDIRKRPDLRKKVA